MTTSSKDRRFVPTPSIPRLHVNKVSNSQLCLHYFVLGQGSLTEGGRLSTVDFLVLTSLDQLIFKLKIIFSFFAKQATLMRRSTVLSLPRQLVFPV
jgi:hypothetical protein